MNNLIYPLIIIGFLLLPGCSQNAPENIVKDQNILKSENLDKYVEFDTIISEKINDYFLRGYHRNRLNGAVLIRQGNQVFSNFYGYRSFSGKDTLNINTAFQLASVSKTITATAVLQLVDQNIISVEDSVNRYLEGFNYEGITVHDLLSHRSGLPNYLYTTDDYWQDHSAPIGMDTAYQLLTCNKPEIYGLPDRRFEYCNTNYFLLALIVEKVSGMGFGQYLKENVFKPAEMNNAFVLSKNTTILPANTAIGSNNFSKEKAPFYQDYLYGDKSIFASVQDLNAFDLALRNGVLISKEVREKSYLPNSKWKPGKSNYGYGWRIFSEDRKNIVFHKGWWRGFRTCLFRDLKNDLCVIVLSNSTKTPYPNLDDITALLEK